MRARPWWSLCEDHCFPADGWAEALVAAHQGPWAAVGPAFLNANPVDPGQLGQPLASSTGRGCTRSPPAPARMCPATTAATSDRSCWTTAIGWPRCWKRKASCTGTSSSAAWRSPWSRPRGPVTRTSRASGRRSCSASAPAGSLRPAAPWAGRCGAGRCFPPGRRCCRVVRTWRTLRDLRRVGDTRPRRGLGLVIFLLCRRRRRRGCRLRLRRRATSRAA